MNWIEIIEIRSSYNSQEYLKSQLQEFFEEIKAESTEQSIRIYNKNNLNSDYIILLLNNSSKVEHGGSQLGLRLSAALKNFGMINYSIWSEIHSK